MKKQALYQATIEKTINCPQCGDELPIYFKWTKLVQCPSCKSTIFLEDQSVKLMGISSVLARVPSLFEINKPFAYQRTIYLPIGKIRYSYGRGFWEEWWLIDDKGKEHWLSVDEGDLVLEQKVETSYTQDMFKSLSVGSIINDNWTVTEIGEAKYEGFEGTIPKHIKTDTIYTYIHLSGKNNIFRTIEMSDDSLETYEGRWISPFDIKRDL
jgi:DNA-directed RNA polymerase subunit RPC12/RpoP